MAAVLITSIVLSAGPAVAQLAPSGSIHVQQPTGIHYIFGAGGTASGGGFFYINYQTSQFDVISPVNVSANGSFSGSSASTGRSVNGQISATAITLTYNGVTVSSQKISPYGPASAFAGAWTGSASASIGGAYVASFANSANGTTLIFLAGGNIAKIGVGSISSTGFVSVRFLSGETVTTSFAPAVGAARGTLQGSNGVNYTYGLNKTIPPRLANISTRGLVGIGEQVLIGGFIVRDGGKTVLLNAKGPSLGSSGVANPVQNPRLDLYFGGQIIASNANWRSNANAGEIAASGAGPSDDREAALQVPLEPGIYTFIASSEDSSQGIGLVEVFGVE